MILPDWTIHGLGERGLIDPYVPEHVNPASLDLTLGGALLYLEGGALFLEPGESLCLPPLSPILVTTAEIISMPNTMAGQLVLKSSMGRRGVQMCNGGWVDPGFVGSLTLTLIAYVPVTIIGEMRFAQLLYHQMHGTPDNPYNGKYQHQRGPTPARNGKEKPE